MSDSTRGSSSIQTGDVLKGVQDEVPINGAPTHPVTPQTAPEGSQTKQHVQPNAQPQAPENVQENVQAESRYELMSRARSFLSSPQVQSQDVAAKRSFLVEKGLNAHEIESLLSEKPLQMPTIPPKTYPQGRPSNLPILLLGLARLFSWLAGGSAVLLLIYYRFLLPRITQTSLARHSLKSHQLSLLREFTKSLSTLKESQAESFSVLPRPDPSQEPKQYLDCSSVSDVLALHGRANEKTLDYSEVPPYTLLRCAIKDLSKDKDGRGTNPTTEELLRYLEGQIPWLVSEDGFEYETKLWNILSTSPLFGKVVPSSSSNTQGNVETSTTSKTHWEYIPPTPLSDPPLIKSLDALSLEVPRDVKSRKSPFQHTLQTMSDFTGYISTQVYLPYRAPIKMGASTPSGLSSIEEDLKKEIRALKGLVLNRRSFMPSLPRPSSSR